MSAEHRHACERSRKLSVALAAVALLVAGCATLDPYNVVGRALPASAPMADAETPEAIRRQRAATVDLVWTTIAERYYRPDLNGVDWPAARLRWRDRAVAAATDDEFWDLLDRMTGELADSHTRVESPRTVALRRAEQTRGLGLQLRELENALVVTGVHSDSDAWWAGVRPGMIVLAIAGEDALVRWRQWAREARPVSSPQAALRLPLRALNRQAEAAMPQGIELSFRRHDGSPLTARLRMATYPAPPTAQARRLPADFAYVRFTAFRESLRQRVIDLIQEHADAPGMVLDLRGNGGGSAAMVDAIASSFFRDRTLLARTQTRAGQPVAVAGVPLIRAERVAAGRPDAFMGPLAVLVDAGTGSAAEALASGLQANGRARVFGEISCGCLLAFLGHMRLPGGGELAYSEVGYTDVRGERVEGRGIVPDESIAPTIATLRDGRDRVLEAALAWLATRTKDDPR